MTMHELHELIRRAAYEAELLPRSEFRIEAEGKNWAIDWVWLDPNRLKLGERQAVVAAFEIDGLGISFQNTNKAIVTLGAIRAPIVQLAMFNLKNTPRGVRPDMANLHEKARACSRWHRSQKRRTKPRSKIPQSRNPQPQSIFLCSC
ncbi:MAG: hypothetical protein IPK13_11605 [Deltaproteobacteria bacterium]|nr:hypothetical protein [Deltaproteobacteria bacterium]